MSAIDSQSSAKGTDLVEELKQLINTCGLASEQDANEADYWRAVRAEQRLGGMVGQISDQAWKLLNEQDMVELAQTLHSHFITTNDERLERLSEEIFTYVKENPSYEPPF